jgi:hypothetical protein
VPVPATDVETMRAKVDLTDLSERLTDLGLKALQWRDNIVASNALSSLGRLALTLCRAKPTLARRLPAWFRVEDEWRQHSPDFLNLSPSATADIERRGTWFEYKVLRAFQLLYQEALTSLRELCFLVGYNTRLIGALAAELGDLSTLDLVIKFFNTFLRAALVAGDVRTAYNVLHQYRQLAQDVLHTVAFATPRVLRRARGRGQGSSGSGSGSGSAALARLAATTERVTQIAEYMAYYGREFLAAGLSFVSVIAAHDLVGICKTSMEHRSKSHLFVLKIFIDFVHSLTTDVDEEERKGVSQ